MWWSATPNGYGLTASDPNGQWPLYLGQRLVAYRTANGVEEETGSYDFRRGAATSFQSGLSSLFIYDIGFSYVSMGDWSWQAIDTNGGQGGDILFVNGERTPEAGIPASGTATYDAHTLSLLAQYYDSAWPGVFFTLTADFGKRTIATQIDQTYHYYDEQTVPAPSVLQGSAVLGIHVGGSAPFSSNGTFDIPLTGTVNYSLVNSPVTPPSEAVTGMMNGAFFGPHAEQVGGTFGLDRADGTRLIQDAFVGKQH